MLKWISLLLADHDERARVEGPEAKTDAASLERAIVGALRSAIAAHGAITPDMIGSAAKRILGSITTARR